MPKKLVFSLLLGGLLSAGTLYLAFRNVPLAQLISYLGTITYAWMAPSLALVVLSFVLRVCRWRLILKDAMALSFWQAFHPLMIGFMINSVLPGRVGELARPVLLKREHGLAFGTGLATVVAERVFDMVVLIALFAAVFPTVVSRPDLDVAFGGMHLNSQTLQAVAWAMIRIGIVLVIGLALLAFSGSRRVLLNTIEWLMGFSGRTGPRLQKHIQRFGRALIGWVESFAQGLKLIGHPRRAIACLALSVMIWAAGVLSYYVFAIGCPGIDLSFTEMAVVTTIICFFIALPSVPGYWGVWEAGGVFALALFGATAQDAAAFTLVSHALQLFPVILIGWLSALVTSINIWQLSYGTKTKNMLEVNA
ncbi:MAG: UPF0104 family protein [Desulfobacteraceae bacterium]|nr:MAG: UPF0104 family protein [Desulfobacteraceae bacterium]